MVTGARSSRASAHPPRAVFLIHDLRAGGAERVYLAYLKGMERVRPVPVLVRPLGRLVGQVPERYPLYHLEPGGTRPIPTGARSVSYEEASRPGRDVLPEESPPAGRDALPEDSRHAGRDVLPWEAVSLLWEAVSLLLKARRLARVSRRESAPLISTFLHKSHVLALVAKMLFDRSLRVVVNVHEQPTQHLETHFSASRARLMRWFYRRGLPMADRIVVVSESIRRELVEHFAVPEALVRVVANPLDLAALRADASDRIPESDLPPGRGPLVVGVGRMEWIKGFDLLLNAVACARRTLPVRLLLVGEGRVRSELEALAARLGLEGCVRFTGYRANPMPYVAAADLLVLSSRTEAWPNVIGEAMAVGTPVLAARCSPGIDELLGAGRYGAVVEANDAAALGEGILDLLSKPERRAVLARSGLERAQAFDRTVVVPRYEALLDELMPDVTRVSA